jgi:hypothetical protein
LVKRECGRDHPRHDHRRGIPDARSNNFISAASQAAGVWGLAYLDISTGTFRAAVPRRPR